MDFKYLYSDAGGLLLGYDAFAKAIISIHEEQIKDPSNKTLLNDMTEVPCISDNGRCAAIFYLLHCVRAPTTKIVNIRNEKKIHTRFSIRNSQSAFSYLGPV